MKTYKNSDDFAKHLMKTAGAEAPKENFVDNVMQSIEAIDTATFEIAYKPLISKMGWVIITFFVVLIIWFLSFGSSDFSYVLPELNLNLDIFSRLNSLEFWSYIKVSKLFTLSFVLFAVLALFQFSMIKNYFNRIDSF
jgi:hypothetical protein